MSYSSLSAFCPLSALRIFTRIAQSALPVFLPASPPPLVCLSKPSPEETPVRVETRSDTIYTPSHASYNAPPRSPLRPPIPFDRSSASGQRAQGGLRAPQCSSRPLERRVSLRTATQRRCAAHL